MRVGVTKAFGNAPHVGIPALGEVDRDRLLEIGAKVWHSARDQITLPSNVGPNHLGDSSPVDLITLWESLPDLQGARVANFYAQKTCGRIPSGTGLAARTAIEVAADRLAPRETLVHEHPLWLPFQARPVETNVARADWGTPKIVPAITVRSFLMGTA